MRPAEIAVFRASLPPIRRQWIRLLANEPPLSALGRTETVGYLMDATFMQLITGLQAASTDSSWPRRLAPVVGPVHVYLACGMTPLRKYFSTGEQAIRACADSALGAKVEAVIAVFKEIAAYEIDALCAACGRSNGSGCEKPKNGPR